MSFQGDIIKEFQHEIRTAANCAFAIFTYFRATERPSPKVASSLTAHNVEKGHGVDLVTGVNRQAGQQIGEQQSSIPTHTTEPERTPQVSVDRYLGGPGLGLGL
jgi:hypothetical protein